MDVSEIAFPVVVFDKAGFDLRRSAAELTTVFEESLRRSFVKGMQIVDSAGRTWRVLDATKIRGAGKFFGYSLMFSRRIEVKLEIDLAPRQFSLAELQARMIKEMRSGGGWQSIEDPSECIDRVGSTESFRSLLEYLVKIAYPA